MQGITFGRPGMEVTARYSPLNTEEPSEVGKVLLDPEYEQKVYTPKDKQDGFYVFGAIGDPGREETVVYRPMDTCKIDIGGIIWSAMNPYLVHNGQAVLLNGQRIYFYRG